MHIVILVALLFAFAVFAPRSWRVFELLILAPIIGAAFGGFIWAVSAMFCGALITWAAFGTFLAGGTIVAEALILKS